MNEEDWTSSRILPIAACSFLGRRRGPGNSPEVLRVRSQEQTGGQSRSRLSANRGRGQFVMEQNHPAVC